MVSPTAIPKGVQKQSHSCSCQGCKATNHTGTLLNLPKHWNSPEPSGTFRKLPPEPTPAHAGTLRNLLEPSSGTCSCDPHRHTPELIWAEDPISLRCWGKKTIPTTSDIPTCSYPKKLCPQNFPLNFPTFFSLCIRPKAARPSICSSDTGPVSFSARRSIHRCLRQ